MGLTIYYSGRFDKSMKLADFIEEVEEVVRANEWNYHLLENEFPHESISNLSDDTLYGIIFSPPGCEPVWLCFLPDGRLSNPVSLKFYRESGKSMKEFEPVNFTKTQYAGVQVHLTIIHLMKYLEKKYFSEFNCMDESLYWETGDKKQAEEKFGKCNMLIDMVENALGNTPVAKDIPMDIQIENILKKLYLKWKKDKQ